MSRSVIRSSKRRLWLVALVVLLALPQLLVVDAEAAPPPGKGNNSPPVARIVTSETHGSVPLSVDFDGSSSSDPDGDDLTYSWDLDGDGVLGDSLDVAPTHVYEVVGSYTITLEVSDGAGTDTDQVAIDANDTERISTNLLAAYDYSEGAGDTVNDVSGVGTPLDLTITDSSQATWIDDALALQGTSIGSNGAATKLIDAVNSAGEFSVEAWLVPADLFVGGVVQIGDNSNQASFYLQDYSYYWTAWEADSNSWLWTNRGAHVVYTHDSSGTVRLYSNGVQADPPGPGGGPSEGVFPPVSWAASHPLIIAPEGWEGEVHLLAVYDRALSPTEVLNNYQAGRDAPLVPATPTDTTPPTVDLIDPTEGDTVFHVETLSATAGDDFAVDRVEFLVGGALVASDTTAPYEFSWDTSSVTDGSHTLKARAFDTSGNSDETDAITVMVANGLRADERVGVDFDRGAITPDEYALYGVYAVTVPPQLPARYQSSSPPVDSTIIAFDFLLGWDDLAQTTKDEILAVLDQPWRGELFIPVGEGSSAATASPSSSTHPDWKDCQIIGNTFVDRCITETAHFRIHYGLATFFPNDGVPDDPSLDDVLDSNLDSAGNQIPDYVDQIAFSLEEVWPVYLGSGAGELGYRTPGDKVDVSIWGLDSGSGQVLPNPGTERIELSNSGVSFYLPRHEFFHIVQYQYVSFFDFLVMGLNIDNTWWWMEATAEWAAHQAAQASSRPEQLHNYANRITAFAGRPAIDLVTLESPPPSDLWRGRAYGSFILAEYLEERYNTKNVIRETWEQYDSGNPGGDTAVRLTVEARGDTFSDVLNDFAQASYLLDFNDSDQPEWRNKLAANSSPNPGEETAGDSLGSSRPARHSHVLAMSSNAGDEATIEYGGSIYVDVAPQQGLVGTMRVEAVDTADTGTLDLRLLAFSSYPTLCADPITIPFDPATGSWTTEVVLGDQCAFATLVATNSGSSNAHLLWTLSFDPVEGVLTPLATFSNVDVVSAGLGGLRDAGTGTIELTGVSGQVEQVYLFWHGPTNSVDTSANATIRLNGNTVTGTHIGFGNDNCWGYANSQSYRADVTSFVSGDGSYLLEDLIKDGGNININGASLVVIFDDGNPDNDVASYLLFEGNDSNIESIYDPANWDAMLPSISYAGGPAALQFHVADGQIWEDDDLVVNGTVIAPGPQVFDGTSVPGSPGHDGNGSLWDIKTFDIAALLSGGDNTLHVTTGNVSDCLSLVAVSAIIGGSDTGPQINGPAIASSAIPQPAPNQGGIVP